MPLGGDAITNDIRTQSAPRRRRLRGAMLLCAWIAAAGLVGCTPQQYARQADRAAYRVIDQKQDIALGRKRDFSIDYRPYEPGSGDRRTMLNGAPLPLGPGPIRVLTLADCLKVAFHNSREFQTRKEALYLSALSLANSRHQWSGFYGSITGEVSRTVEDRGNNVNSATAGLSLSFEQRLVNGGILTVAAGLGLVSDLLNMDGTTFTSSLSTTFTQPLLRGALAGLAYEDLFRQERDVAIDVLGYERYTQTFATDITTDYYGVLQRRDEVANERANIERLQTALRRVTVQVEGGQVSRTEQDQTAQNLLNAQVRYAEVTQRYLNQLDRFKITLGLPVSTRIELDGEDLGVLNRRGPAPLPFLDEQALADIADQAATAAAEAFDREHPNDTDPVSQRIRGAIIAQAQAAAYEQARGGAVDEAVDLANAIALHTQPEVLRTLASLRDATADVAIAANNFLPLLDLELSASVAGKKPHEPFGIQWHRSTRRAQLNLDYSLDQTDNRDDYAAALISEARAVRELEAFIDNVRLDVLESYRGLLQARRSYDLQVRNVAVAVRRSALAALEQAEGEASARDVLEAEDDLRQAQNGLTGAMVSYETTRIQFLASLGMLDVDKNGRYLERDKPFLFEQLGARYGNVDDIGF